MPFETLERYEDEAATERGGWRGAVGKILTFVGFIVLANAFLVALFFRHILPLRNQLILAALGGLVGVTGMLLRGNRRTQIWEAAGAAAIGIAVTALLNLVEQRYGWFVLLAVVLGFAWLVQKLEERSWKKL